MKRYKTAINFDRLFLSSLFLFVAFYFIRACSYDSYIINSVNKRQKIYVNQHLDKYEPNRIGVKIKSDVDGKGFITIEDTYNQEPTYISGKKYYIPLYDTIWLNKGHSTSYWSRDWYVDTLSFHYHPITIKQGKVKIFWKFNHLWWPQNSKNVQTAID